MRNVTDGEHTLKLLWARLHIVSTRLNCCAQFCGQCTHVDIIVHAIADSERTFNLLCAIAMLQILDTRWNHCAYAIAMLQMVNTSTCWNCWVQFYYNLKWQALNWLEQLAHLANNSQIRKRFKLTSESVILCTAWDRGKVATKTSGWHGEVTRLVQLQCI